jgi:glycine betaine catabolism A
MTFHPTATTYLEGSKTLPREIYTHEAVLAEERERIFSRSWNCVGRSSSISSPGDYIVRTIAGDSIIILRDSSGAVRAFFNTCRHRGTQLCSEASGRFSETIQCPYHAWTYSTDGRLLGAPHMNDVPDFDKTDYPLHAARVAEWEGFLFVNLSDEAQPFEEVWAPMIGRLTRFNLANLAVGHRVRYEVHANWKLVFQNYSECLHCPMIHPQLNAVLPYQSGANDLIEGPFLGGYMEITPPHESATMSGRACGHLVGPDAVQAGERRAYYYTLMPNMMLSLHPDYVNYYIVHPLAADRTLVESEWLFHSDTLTDAHTNIHDAIEFWDVTNRQDWEIVERSHRGIASSRYEPGPYSARESIPAAWDREYVRLMRQ